MDPARADWVPVDACTLPTAEQPLRLAEFDDLFAASLRAVTRRPGSDTGGRLVFAGDEALSGRVRRLVDAESACCSFFAFTVTAVTGDVPTTVTLDIEVAAAHADVLAALLDRAERVAGAAA
jgi:hypothetical protein